MTVRLYLEPYHALGLIYSERAEYQEAVKWYTKAIEIDPKSAAAYKQRAKLYRDLGKDKEAEDDERVWEQLRERR